MWKADPEKGVWLLPTRKRYQNIKRFMDSLKESETSTPGWIIVSDWDVGGYQFQEFYPGWKMIVTKGESQGDKIRELWDRIRDLDWIGWLGDDQTPITKGWDRKYIEALNGCNIVTCNDDWAIHGDAAHQYERMAGAWAWSGPLLRAIGYFFPANMHHTCMDDAFETLDVAESISTKLHDVTIKHFHYQNGGAVEDDTYQIAYGKYGNGDEGKWRRWAYDTGVDGMAQAAANIRALKASMK